jgi:transcriptional regulator with XRE-family HTH domain
MKEKDDLKIRSAFGSKVKKIREQKNLTQLDLSAKCGVDIRQIQRIENSEITTSISMAYIIAKSLGIPTGDLFDF